MRIAKRFVRSGAPAVFECDMLVVGGGCSGVCAAIEGARGGLSVVLAADTIRLGGMLTAAGVSAADGGERLSSGIWGEFRRNLLAYYGGEQTIRSGWVSNTCFDPAVGARILGDMVQEAGARGPGQITRVHFRSIDNVVISGHGLRAVRFRGCSSHSGSIPGLGESGEAGYIEFRASTIVEATECGDLLAKLPVRSRCGRESYRELGESGAPQKADRAMQDITWVATLPLPQVLLEQASTDEMYPTPGVVPEGTVEPIPEPSSDRRNDSIRSALERADLTGIPRPFRAILDLDTGERRSWRTFFEYGRLPGGMYMLNWPQGGNDYAARYAALEKRVRRRVDRRARAKTMKLARYLECRFGLPGTRGAGRRGPYPGGAVPALIPYVRESRRLVRTTMLTVDDVTGDAPDGMPFDSRARREAVAVCDYPADVHMLPRLKNRCTLPDLPAFSLPLSAMIPDELDGLIVAEKSAAVSHLVASASRVQPTAMGLGQAAGALAVEAHIRGVAPRSVPVEAVQDRLISAGCLVMPFSDLPAGHPAFVAIQRAAVRGLIFGESLHTPWVNQTVVRAEQPPSPADTRRLGVSARTRGEAALLWDNNRKGQWKYGNE